MGASTRVLVGLSVLVSFATSVHAQCDYRSNLAPLESIEGLAPENIQATRALRERIATALEGHDERIEFLSREENERIRAVVDGNREQVFFLYIFNGYMPLPDRFVARSPGRFQSMAGAIPRDTGSPQEPENAIRLSGSVSFGSRSELSMPSEELRELCDKVEFTRHGLNVEVRDYPGSRWVLVYDDNEFLSIIDFNRSLWDAMLDVWHELDSRRNE